MKLTFLALIITSLAFHCAIAADFTRASVFESVEAFTTAAKAFQPAAAKSDLSNLFAAKEQEPESSQYNKTFFAQSVEAVTVLWSDDSHALIFATAAPPIDSMPCAVGVLFLLQRVKETWRIADSRKFTAHGKYAHVSAEQTADAGAGWILKEPVITITESQGGRGYAYSLSGSYIFKASKLKPFALE
jgi:hypothetical protein